MSWALLAGIIVAAVFIRRLVMLLVSARANAVLTKVTGPSHQSAIVRLAGPAGSLIGILVVRGFLPLLGLGEKLTYYIDSVFEVLLAVVAVQLIFRLVDVASGVFQRRAVKTSTKLDDQLIPIFSRMFKFVIGAFAFIFILQNFDINVTALLAGVSLGGLALSLASKDTAANIFSSLSIFTDRPFQIGDWVRIGEFEGTVTEVGMRSTRLRSLARSIVTVPNAIVATTTINNFGVRDWNLVSTTLALNYETSADKIQSFVKAIIKVLRENSMVVDDNWEVHFYDFCESSLNLMVQFYIRTNDYSEALRIRHEVLLDIMRVSEKLDVDFAVRARTLSISQPDTNGKATEEVIEKPARKSAADSEEQKAAPQK